MSPGDQNASSSLSSDSVFSPRDLSPFCLLTPPTRSGSGGLCSPGEPAPPACGLGCCPEEPRPQRPREAQGSGWAGSPAVGARPFRGAAVGTAHDSPRVSAGSHVYTAVRPSTSAAPRCKGSLTNTFTRGPRVEPEWTQSGPRVDTGRHRAAGPRGPGTQGVRGGPGLKAPGLGGSPKPWVSLLHPGLRPQTPRGRLIGVAAEQVPGGAGRPSVLSSPQAA